MLVRPVATSIVVRLLQGHGESISIALTFVAFLFNVVEASCLGGIAYAIFADRPEAGLNLPGKAAAGMPTWNAGR
jgi:hypothetical protein